MPDDEHEPSGHNRGDDLRRRLPDVVAAAGSMGEIETWLAAQPWVERVTTEEYLLKSNPPRRVLTIVPRGGDASGERLELIVVELPDSRYRFWGLREV